MQIQIGKSDDKQHVRLDVPKLLDTRMLIQGTSGSGKSWLLRLIAERCGSELHTIIIDPEGEFATLRERLDILLVGQHGELQTDPRSASLLARRLKELRVSAVIDLSELKLHDRRRFVRLFIEALLDLPRALWGPTLIVLDESDLYCPERGMGESESTAAVIDLCTRGRKRGLGSALVTHRLSKLNKDAAAELGNVLIGRTPLDIDAKRAIDILGMTTAEKRILRDLEDGEFFGFGPAFNTQGVARFVSDPVETTHPRAGERSKIEAPKPSASIKRILPEFADLATKADEEVRTLVDAKKTIADLQRQLKATDKPTDPKATEAAEAQQLRAAVLDRDRLLSKIMSVSAEIESLVVLSGSVPTRRSHEPGKQNGNRPAAKPDVSRPTSGPRIDRPSQQLSLGKAGDRRMLIALAQNPTGLADKKLSILAGVSRKGGSFGTYLSKLRGLGYIDGDRNSFVRITDAGVDALGHYEPLPTGPALIEYWQAQLGNTSGDRRMFDALVETYPAKLTREQLSEASAVSLSGGSFGTYLSKLRSLELAEGRDELRASSELFGEAL